MIDQLRSRLKTALNPARWTGASLSSLMARPHHCLKLVRPANSGEMVFLPFDRTEGLTVSETGTGPVVVLVHAPS